ncbi:hypothetical protein C5B42_01030 [Candidatus Cerribacteria bacterium 'Amazon FNV 2010 28 9']|uniref:PEGA domain-containing protein n=1 Tax=Candidatus Cerribacteria bacterium 'Amazon FNV 2010 28 9' TaxID=2081795 RepID=A0A317JQ38_9BACT|nr:MAG: hypothetical protein C5B42_01030 [Candidatus Cerribacteria bacterium 'Amazon FNV 2010 28 9']
MNKRVLFTFLSFVFIVVGTILAIRYAEGYRPTTHGIVKATGLLAANSFPNGASLYINGNLTSATDTTINLSPGSYDLEIRKEGYFPWRKKVELDSELVTQTNAMLFPTAPGLSPLTYIGADHIFPSPDGQKLLFMTASASAQHDNGLYILDLSDNPLALQRGPRQIAQETSNSPFEKAQYLWSPDSNQVLVSWGNKNILLDANRFTDMETAQDITVHLTDTLATWKTELDRQTQVALSRFPSLIQQIATGSAIQVHISPDQYKLLYTATASATLPATLLSPVPAADSQPQERTIAPGNTYVYDRREDRNFLVEQVTPVSTPTPSPLPKNEKKSEQPALVVATPQKPSIFTTIDVFNAQYSGFYTHSAQWLPDSRHVIIEGPGSITIIEYDGTNTTQIYAGPFIPGVIYPSPNGSEIIILTNFNQPSTVPQNLYAVSLK